MFLRFSTLIATYFLLMMSIQAQEEESWSPGEYMQQATSNAFEKASLMNALSEFSVSKNLRFPPM